MKRARLLVLTLLLFGIQFGTFSQDKLALKSNFWGNRFYKGDTLISVNQVLEEMAPNEANYNLMKSAKKDFVTVQLLGAAGGLLFGWPIGASIAGGDPNWTLVGVGAGILAVSIPISINFKKKATSAITKHNSLITTSSNNHNYKPCYRFCYTGNSAKIQFKF